ncbi:hypothetical protein GJS41_02920 [Kangiella sp. HZ709]|nr:hypothetical protein [Kangiella sp. HZ709]
MVTIDFSLFLIETGEFKMFSNLFKKLKLVAISGAISAMVASPAMSEDIEIFFGEAKTANMMLVLDLSGSMAFYPNGREYFAVNGDGIHVDGDGDVVASEDELIVKEWTVTKNNFTFDDAVALLPDPSVNPKARYPHLQVFWYEDDGVDYWLDWVPWNVFPGYIDEKQNLGRLNKDERYRWYYKDNRITQLKEAIYDFLADTTVTRDIDQIGMMTYATGSDYYTRNPNVDLIEQIRPLSKVTGGETHRDTLVNSIFEMWPVASTPTAEGYYRATQYLGGSYTQNGSAVPSPILDGACGFNNSIVLLTDGTPTAFDSNTHSSVEKIIGTCDDSDSGGANATNYGKECTEDLSAHYFVNDVKSNFPGSTINTSTVAFALNDTVAETFLENTASTLNGEKLFFKPTDAKELAQVFKNILLSTQDSTSFVAPSVPLSQSNRLKHSNDLYMAMFKPEGKETWSGNLKKYSLKEGNIVDANGVVAVDVNNGTFLDTAESHWFVKDYTDPNNPIVADGNEIALGGAMPKISVGTTPKVYSNLNSNSLNQLTETFTKTYVNDTNLNVLKTLFGNSLLTKDIAQENFDWIRDRVNGSTNRFGDALHSRPQILEYTNKTVAFISTNEGYLHAIDTATGDELWSFFPRQLLNKVETWRSDQSLDPTNVERQYGLDGQMHIHSFVDSGGNQKHHLYFGMRRGGNNIYAMDVSSETNPPQMLYTVSDQFDLTTGQLGYNKAGDTENRATITNLAQSWSLPVIVQLPANNTNKYEKRLVFPGGFDTYYDDTTNAINPGAGIKGNAIYSLPFYESTASVPASISATTLIGTGVISNSIASNLTFIDLNNDEVVDSIYAADVGGKIYRADLTTTTSTVDLLADVGADSDGSYRFYSKPDVVFADYKGVSFATVAIGTGHRSDPKNNTSVDKFYAFFDREITGDQAANDNDPITPNKLFDVTTGTTDANGETSFYELDDIIAAGDVGWYIELASGEKVLANSTTIDFNIFFTTFIPAQGANCGVSSTVNRLYGVSLLEGAPSVRAFETGLLADPTDRYTNVNYVGIAPGVTILFPEDTSIATLVGTQTVCTGDDCDFYKGGVRTVKWREKK